MTFNSDDLLLYAVTDHRQLDEMDLVPAVEAALRGGATMIQLREKRMEPPELLAMAHRIKQLCEVYKTPLIINDDPVIALACDAHGVHVGQADESPAILRGRLGPKAIIGVSVRTVEQALTAQSQGASYLGVGALFPTDSKKDAEAVTAETLRKICQAVRIPVVAIGGISLTNGLALAGTGIAGIAVISALFGEPDIELAAARLAKMARHITGAARSNDQEANR